jgi:hypothetical protein
MESRNSQIVLLSQPRLCRHPQLAMVVEVGLLVQSGIPPPIPKAPPSLLLETVEAVQVAKEAMPVLRGVQRLMLKAPPSLSSAGVHHQVVMEAEVKPSLTNIRRILWRMEGAVAISKRQSDHHRHRGVHHRW